VAWDRLIERGKVIHPGFQGVAPARSLVGQGRRGARVGDASVVCRMN